MEQAQPEQEVTKDELDKWIDWRPDEVLKIILESERKECRTKVVEWLKSGGSFWCTEFRNMKERVEHVNVLRGAFRAIGGEDPASVEVHLECEEWDIAADDDAGLDWMVFRHLPRVGDTIRLEAGLAGNDDLTITEHFVQGVGREVLSKPYSREGTYTVTRVEHVHMDGHGDWTPWVKLVREPAE